MHASAQAYLLDTNVFDRVLEGKTSLSSFGGRRLLVIGIQRDELSKAKDPKRTALLATFEAINPTVEPAASMAFGIEGVGWGQACWNDGSGKFDEMLNRLRELDSKSKNKSRNPLNKERDIFIAETAIKNGATLVSDDFNLRQVVSEFGGCAIEVPKLAASCP
jgi:hypothetical protein